MAARPKRSANAPSRRALIEWLGIGSRLAIAIAAIAFVVVAWLHWKTLRQIERLLVSTQRPWISASVEPVELTFDDKGGGLTLKTTIKNIGTVPAVDVLATPVLLMDAKQPYRKACSHYGVGGGIGPMLSGNETVPKTSTAWLARGDFGDSFPTLVAVCIKYRFANSRRTGEAGYLFSIAQRDPSRPDAVAIEPKNGTLNAPQLVLLPTASYHN
jgi:hypothetical protein